MRQFSSEIPSPALPEALLWARVQESPQIWAFLPWGSIVSIVSSEEKLTSWIQGSARGICEVGRDHVLSLHFFETWHCDFCHQEEELFSLECGWSCDVPWWMDCNMSDSVPVSRLFHLSLGTLSAPHGRWHHRNRWARPWERPTESPSWFQAVPTVTSDCCLKPRRFGMFSYKAMAHDGSSGDRSGCVPRKQSLVFKGMEAVTLCQPLFSRLREYLSVCLFVCLSAYLSCFGHLLIIHIFYVLSIIYQYLSIYPSILSYINHLILSSSIYLPMYCLPSTNHQSIIIIYLIYCLSLSICPLSPTIYL